MGVSLKRRVLAELIGTFFLCMAVSLPTDPPVVVVFAAVFTIIALVYCLAPISGCHINPGVTLAVLLRGKIPLAEVLPYMAAHIAGAFLAGACAFAMVTGNESTYPVVNDDHSSGEAIIAEAMPFAFLVWCALHTTTTKAQENNSYFGIAVGFVIMAGAFTSGEVSGGVFNIAVAMLPFIHGHSEDLWIYIVGSLVGLVIGMLMFYVTALNEFYHPSDGKQRQREIVSVAGTEICGTALLAYAVGMSPNAGEFGALAIGAQLVALVYTGAATSGSHFNPAVTVGIYLRGIREKKPLLTLPQVMAYIACQLVGGFIGGAVALSIMHDDMGYPDIKSGYTWKAGIVAEICYTGILVFTVLHLTTTPKTQGNSYFGTAIGLVVASGAYSVGGMSGASFNPAIGIAMPALAGDAENIWVYTLGPLVGSVAAVGLFYITEDRSHKRRYSIYMEGTSQPETRAFSKYMPSPSEGGTEGARLTEKLMEGYIGINELDHS